MTIWTKKRSVCIFSVDLAIILSAVFLYSYCAVHVYMSTVKGQEWVRERVPKSIDDVCYKMKRDRTARTPKHLS